MFGRHTSAAKWWLGALMASEASNTYNFPSRDIGRSHTHLLQIDYYMTSPLPKCHRLEEINDKVRSQIQ